MNKNIPIQTAKAQLVKINKILDKPHALIGGLAVQHYYVARESEDIDLVISSGTARKIIDLLYSNKDWKTKDKNDDEYRPAFEITSRIDHNKVIFLGPKIMEREEYDSISWDSLLEGSEPFTYKKQKLENIRVPRLETLAFTKLLSFINRISKSKSKGEALSNMK